MTGQPGDDAVPGTEELRRRLAELSAEAAHNETIMKRTQARELLLLGADSLGRLLSVMTSELRVSYGLEVVSAVLLDPQHELRHLLAAGGGRSDEHRQVLFVDSLSDCGPALGTLQKPWLGPYVGADHHVLFRGAPVLGSIALVPLPRNGRAIGVMCFGSRDPKRFTRHHGTEFLAHLGAVAAVCCENAVNRARLLRAGITDFLTGWHNRRYLQQRLKEELARAQRDGGSIACLMIDIDRFKGVNDAYGHLAGDNALKEVARRIETQMRSMDTAARFGGDELAILVPGTSAEEAAKLGERIRAIVAARPIALNAETERAMSVSVGVAAIRVAAHAGDLKELAERLLADADAALYRAKALGRNRVQLGAG